MKKIRNTRKIREFPRKPARLLVRSTNWIGDAVMTTPAIRTIKENYPDTEITLMALPWVSDVFAFCPHVDRIFTYDKEGRHKGLSGKLLLARDLGREKFDAAILLQNAFEAALITTLACIPARGGYTTDGRGLLLTHGIKKPAGIDQRHQVHYYQQMLAGLGLRTGPDELELFVSPQKLHGAQEALADVFSGRGRAPVIGLNPGAAYGPAKRWPAEKFAELAKMVHEQTECLILVFGTKADNHAASLIQRALADRKRCMDLTGSTDLATAIAYIGCCDAFVTNDSGLMHVAAAVDTPLVALFGSTDHVATGPHGRRAVVLRKDLPCSPCKKTHCPEKHFACMEKLSAREVCSSVLTLLEKYYAKDEGKKSGCFS
ncbi:MAG TPA: lipopolysaccharide heptosyltransferase II [Desulfobulbus sp.]|nr:lipopolysaccharide heptosyltransferase II [Desulfobulbus sp.]